MYAATPAIRRGLLNPVNPTKDVAWIQQYQKEKFAVPENELDTEAFLKKITPSAKEKRKMVKKWLGDKKANILGKLLRLDAAGRSNARGTQLKAEINALAMWENQMECSKLEDQADHEFSLDFYGWLAGKGKEADHQKTPWYRHRIPDLEVQAYLVSFAGAKIDWLHNIEKLVWKAFYGGGLEGLNEYYMFFKYLVRGGWKDRDSAEFLYDWNKYLGWDERYVGQTDETPNTRPTVGGADSIAPDRAASGWEASREAGITPAIATQILAKDEALGMTGLVAATQDVADAWRNSTRPAAGLDCDELDQIYLNAIRIFTDPATPCDDLISSTINEGPIVAGPNTINMTDPTWHATMKKMERSLKEGQNKSLEEQRKLASSLVEMNNNMKEISNNLIGLATNSLSNEKLDQLSNDVLQNRVNQSTLGKMLEGIFEKLGSVDPNPILSRLDEKINSLKPRTRIIRENTGISKEDHGKAQKEIETLKTQLQQHTAYNQSLTEQHSTQNEELNVLRDRLNDLESREDKTPILTEQITKLRSLTKQKEETIASLQRERDDASNKLNYSNQVYNARQEEWNTHAQAQAQERERLERLVTEKETYYNQQLEELSGRLRFAENAFNAQKDEFAQGAFNLVQKSDSEQETLKTTLRKTKEERDKLQEDFNNLYKMAQSEVAKQITEKEYAISKVKEESDRNLAHFFWNHVPELAYAFNNLETYESYMVNGHKDIIKDRFGNVFPTTLEEYNYRLTKGYHEQYARLADVDQKRQQAYALFENAKKEYEKLQNKLTRTEAELADREKGVDELEDNFQEFVDYTNNSMHGLLDFLQKQLGYDFGVLEKPDKQYVTYEYTDDLGMKSREVQNLETLQKVVTYSMQKIKDVKQQMIEEDHTTQRHNTLYVGRVLQSAYENLYHYLEDDILDHANERAEALMVELTATDASTRLKVIVEDHLKELQNLSQIAALTKIKESVTNSYNRNTSQNIKELLSIGSGIPQPPRQKALLATILDVVENLNSTILDAGSEILSSEKLQDLDTHLHDNETSSEEDMEMN
jgi:hypothetical protein